jgi:hypothetical protein
LSAIVFGVSVQSSLCFAPNPALQWTVPGAIRGVKFGALSSIFIASDRRHRISGPATELGSLGQQMKIKIITPLLLLVIPFLSGCVESESDREVLLRQADSYEQRGFSMTAADRRKEAFSASDKQKTYFTIPDSSPPPSSSTKSSSVIVEGNEKDGFDAFPKTRISVTDAIERAKPYLEISTLRRAEMLNNIDRPNMILWVHLIDGEYFISKDVYPAKLSKTLGAVVVNAASGKVTPPK